ncbi:MAG TPA: PilZ domain-containing protein [Terriglobales bacterium]|nr:PilZ domain-containing protein [Terriglobales bacterium]
MDRRLSPRIQVQLPVQVWGMDAHGQPFTQPGLVINMSVGGLVIQGVRRKIRTGEVLDVQMGQVRAQFRVVWVAIEGNGEIGLQRLTLHTFVAHSVLTHCAASAAAC